MAPLVKLLQWAREHCCSLLAVSDEDSSHDTPSAAVLRFCLGNLEDLGAQTDLMLLVTPERLQLHCCASALAGVCSALGAASAAPLPVDIFSPDPHHKPDSDAALDFKLEARP